jgi:DNA polymerase-1
MKVLIVDGNNLIYSSYYASQKMQKIAADGAIFLFLRVLISIIKKNNYEKILVIFDGGGTNFRHLLSSNYKIKRKKMPEGLWEQMVEVKSLLTKTNVANIQLKNHEADDVIASFIIQNDKKKNDLNFDIFTRDKDLMQLISENTNILKYAGRKISLYTKSIFYQEYNFLPGNYTDYLSLIGDKVDDIEGARGIGPVSAKKIIQQFSTVENIYCSFDERTNNLPDITKKILRENQQLILRNKKIISLENNILLPFTIEECDFN